MSTHSTDAFGRIRDQTSTAMQKYWTNFAKTGYPRKAMTDRTYPSRARMGYVLSVTCSAFVPHHPVPHLPLS